MTDREFDLALDELSTWEGDAAPLDPAARHRVRTRLLSAMETRRRPLWQRTGPRIAVSGLATAAIAATVLVAVRDDGGSAAARPATAQRTEQPAMRPVSARTVLTGAAAYDREHSQAPTTPPRDDQFIYTKEIVKETNRKTGGTRTYVDEIWRSVDGSQRSWIMEIGKGWWSEPLKKNESSWPPQDWRTLEKLPTDPDRLILSLLHKTGGSARNGSLDGITDQDWSLIHFSLAGLLKLVPVMPEGLRPAAFEALGKVPGVKTVPNQKDAKGRTGVAITYDDPTLPKGVTSFGGYFIFDPRTYEFLGSEDDRSSGDGAKKKTYTQLSYLDSWAITDKVKQRP
ncbi:CU044_5270 family protein [Streptomyces sp. HUAS MG91]|uniref:CU044_5270 family protein n=1 Tax=Streptomyces tabacisoli TaxID=3156398 RepID=A0AAU8IRK5_9ACTN